MSCFGAVTGSVAAMVPTAARVPRVRVARTRVIRFFTGVSFCRGCSGTLKGASDLILVSGPLRIPPACTQVTWQLDVCGVGEDR